MKPNKYVPITTQNLLYMQQPKAVPVNWVSKPIRKLNSGVWHNLNKQQTLISQYGSLISYTT